MDYEKSSNNYLKLLLNDERVSDVNLKYFNDFLKQYDVSPARKGIFFRSIRKLFSYSKDFKTEMHSREAMNDIYQHIRDEGNSDSMNQTVMSCARTLAIWLNEGVKPKGFIDIKFHKKKYKRKLQSKDMITWEDVLKVCSKTKSVQMQAILTTLLDGAFRPSEFVNLKYGDVDISEKPFIYLDVDGKTGERSVWIYQASPYLERWLNAHPTKKATDPLWVIETPSQSRSARKHGLSTPYSYPAMQKRIKTLFAQVNITTDSKSNILKPCDFYNFRHSGAILMGLTGVPVEKRASKMGHSVEMQIDTYGRWDKEKERKVLRGVFGIETQQDSNKPLLCKFCNTTNEPTEEYCVQCNNPLTTEVAVRDKQKEEEKWKQIEDRLTQVEITSKLDTNITSETMTKKNK